MPTPFRLADEFTDPPAEQALLAALARDPARYWELVDLLPPGAFTAEAGAWEELAAAVEAERPPTVPADWTPAPDPEAVARRLADLHQRRLLAEAQERLAQALLDESRPAQELAALLEEEAARVQAAVRELRAGRLLWASELVAQVVQEAEERRRQREETGRAVTGVPTGLSKLDQLLNGLGTGLYVLAGAPGAGKTTLSLQLALQAARDGVPAVYVSYENSPSNLVQKAICARAGIPSSDVERGFGDLVRLRQAAAELRPVLGRLAIIEGTSRLTVPQVRAKALQALNRTRAKRCLVVFDYLQRAAHGQGYDQLRHNVSALAGELRDLANRLDSPVLAISSQNRTAGAYGEGGGKASLDSLKESGDLEYSADAVLFVVPARERQATPPARAVDLVVLKNRFGDIGSVPLIFRPDTGVFREEERTR